MNRPFHVRRRSPEGGWSYLELILSLSILVVLIGSLFVAGSRDLQYVAECREEGIAERAAAARLEVLLAGRERPEPGTREVKADRALAEALPGARVEEEVRVLESGLHAVEVRVTWPGAGGARRSFRLSTLVARGDRP